MLPSSLRKPRRQSQQTRSSIDSAGEPLSPSDSPGESSLASPRTSQDAATPRPALSPGEDGSVRLAYAYEIKTYLFSPSDHYLNFGFSQASFNSMLLLPPDDAESSEPLYRISVEMNCFRPGSYITIIHRGESEDSTYVGEFECVLFGHKDPLRVLTRYFQGCVMTLMSRTG